MMRLENLAAVVTGGGSGIGAGVARAFAREGAWVAVFDVNEAAGRRVVEDCPGGIAIGVDVADSAAVDKAFSDVGQAFGTLDVLANIAGVTDVGERDERINSLRMQQREELAATGGVQTPLDATVTMSDDEWDRVLSVNLAGTFYCTRAALRIMGPNRSGAIVNTSSVVGLTGYAGSARLRGVEGRCAGFHPFGRPGGHRPRYPSQCRRTGRHGHADNQRMPAAMRKASALRFRSDGMEPSRRSPRPSSSWHRMSPVTSSGRPSLSTGGFSPSERDRRRVAADVDVVLRRRRWSLGNREQALLEEETWSRERQSPLTESQRGVLLMRHRS